ncbi:glycosyltransferase [Flavobacteriaceae bacterium 14752]|uniref:glycosyltransferase n=1 Tax=Mesohalobacter salilacus TaxID=2491711 RepID=UPI000F632CE8|nr:glycosyltransferase [Flavobacteriaceae bacterium 14752]
MTKGSVLVAPLNWGLGHATRCIPIIKALQQQGYTPIIASDGDALGLLKKEFSDLKFYELPSLRIKYAKRGFWFKFKIILQLFRFYQCIAKEQKFIKQLADDIDLKGIIADNRLGLFHQQIPSVIISHQLKVFSGNTTWLTTKLHQKFIAKYHECWVPDYPNRPYLSGKLGHLVKTKLNLKYIGVLSRFELREKPITYDILVLLSGPEPQRSMLEKRILKTFKNYNGRLVLVRGLVDAKDNIVESSNFKVYDYLTAKPLETIILQSQIVVARSGYTTLMDLAKLRKKAFFIPTPGQSEQQYLAKRLKRYQIAPYCQQDKFDLNELQRVNSFKGLGGLSISADFVFSDIFNLFDGK